MIERYSFDYALHGETECTSFQAACEAQRSRIVNAIEHHLEIDVKIRRQDLPGDPWVCEWRVEGGKVRFKWLDGADVGRGPDPLGLSD